ncbi:1-acyl-sn-glycerol-3-phosphate acyltransferase [Muriicola sp.]|uniref:1-acyl-sn-glycerol-3-phosphate acyltransferase n=3 Tax=Muriicola sp. TaxID=2020856 RepID=UPI0035612A29
MRRLMYDITRRIACFGLFCYYRDMRLNGYHKVPKNKAVMFLANHQNALMDPLVIAAYTPFRTYFLTRADVFVNPVVNQIFRFLRMLPIYRMRDGRDTLGKNEEIFQGCIRILQGGGHILLFPEANHNIMRKVRPLSKGFTRILFAALDRDEDLDVLLVPVGINYENASGFPDRVAFYFDDPVSSRAYYDKDDIPGSVSRIKQEVSEALQRNTTHIAPEEEYADKLAYLDSLGFDYLDPRKTHAALENYPGQKDSENRKTGNPLRLFLKWTFYLINAPTILVWRVFLKPRILEEEFISTFRFAYAVVIQPIFYILFWWLCYTKVNALWASSIVILHFLLSLLYVKTGSSRKG